MQSPLHRAVKHRQYQAVQSLLRAGANPLEGSSIVILEEACRNGYIDDVKALLKHMVKGYIRHVG
jgi:ankyrin repeat protein